MGRREAPFGPSPSSSRTQRPPTAEAPPTCSSAPSVPLLTATLSLPAVTPNQPKRSGSYPASQPLYRMTPKRNHRSGAVCGLSLRFGRQERKGGRRSLKPLSDAPSTSLPQQGSTTDLIRPTVSGPAGLQASGAPLSPPPGNVRVRGVTAFPIPAGIRREEADHPNPSPSKLEL